MTTLTLILTCAIALAITLAISNWYWYKQIKSIKTDICSYIEETNTWKEKTDAAISDIYKILDEQREFNKHTTQSLAQIDIALIRLIDVPFLFDQLDPGYSIKWTGEIPYPINEVFINSKIKIGDYEYNIDAIDGSYLTISRS